MAKILSKIASDMHQAQQMKEIQEFKELHDINVANATRRLADPNAPVIEVCWGADCLFEVRGSPYGVRELKINYNGEQYWFHHEWGITEKADALHFARKLYADRGYNPLQFENKYVPDAVHGLMPVREKEETFP